MRKFNMEANFHDNFNAIFVGQMGEGGEGGEDIFMETNIEDTVIAIVEGGMGTGTGAGTGTGGTIGAGTGTGGTTGAGDGGEGGIMIEPDVESELLERTMFKTFHKL